MEKKITAKDCEKQVIKGSCAWTLEGKSNSELMALVNQCVGEFTNIDWDSTRQYFHVGVYKKTVQRVGRKFFTKTTSEYLVVDGKANKVYGNLTPTAAFMHAVKDGVYSLQWMKVIQDKYRFVPRVTKTLALQIVKGKITNYEAFFKAQVKSSYRGSGLHWYNVPKLVNSGFPAGDLMLFKEDINQVVEALDDILFDKWLLRDVINDAVFLPDFTPSIKWSDKRLREEHLKNQRLIKIARDSNYTKPVFQECLVEAAKRSGFKLINSALEAEEAAQKFGNCSYNHYWPKVVKGLYMLLTTTIGGEPAMIGLNLLGVRLDEQFSIIDQVYHKYNAPVKPEMMQIFMEDNKHTLTMLAEWAEEAQLYK